MSSSTNNRSRSNSRTASGRAGTKTAHQNPPAGNDIGQLKNNYYHGLPMDDDGTASEYSTASGMKFRQPAPAKPPPITIENITVTGLQGKLKSISSIDYASVRMKASQSGVKILAAKDEDYKIIKKFCEEQKLSGYTHSLKSEQQIKFCLYGLWEMPCDEVLNELKLKSIQPVQLRQLSLKKKRYSDQAIYLVYFNRSQAVKLNDLKKVTGLFNMVVEWKHYKRYSNEPTQCSRCQQFGHGASNCFKQPKCVRCAGDHLSKDCDLLPKIDANSTPATNFKPKIPEDKVKCALCDGQHTANYRQCEERSKFKKLQRTLQDRGQHRSKRQPLPRDFLGHQNFPTSQKATIPPFVPAPQPRINAWAPPTSRLLTTDECMDIFNLFTTELLKCRTIEDQIRTIAKLSFDQVSKYLNNNRHHESK